MGNKFACGCSTYATTSRKLGFNDSPYSKHMSKHLVRFWAEVFILAQDGVANSADSTRWQLVVPKLVPVNLARVQDAPVLVSHVTAYNTKVEKIMDVLLCHPGTDLFRPSDCFVYWTDSQNFLTWGLNFINSEDATHFINMICGRTKGILCRRANSSASLSAKNKHDHSKQSSTSIPATPEGRRSACNRPSVKFADKPVCISPASSHNVQITNLAASPRSPTKNKHQYQSQDQLDKNNSQPPLITDPRILMETGKRLSDWRIIIGPDGRETFVPIEPSKTPPPVAKVPVIRRHQVITVPIRLYETSLTADANSIGNITRDSQAVANNNNNVSSFQGTSEASNHEEVSAHSAVGRRTSLRSFVPTIPESSAIAQLIVRRSDSSGVWEKASDAASRPESLPPAKADENVQSVSLDSQMLKRMLDPLAGSENGSCDDENGNDIPKLRERSMESDSFVEVTSLPEPPPPVNLLTDGDNGELSRESELYLSKNLVLRQSFAASSTSNTRENSCGAVMFHSLSASSDAASPESDPSIGIGMIPPGLYLMNPGRALRCEPESSSSISSTEGSITLTGPPTPIVSNNGAENDNSSSCKVELRQNDQRISLQKTITSSRQMKRSSLHLLTNGTGRFQNLGGSGLTNRMFDDASMSSSLLTDVVVSETGTSQPAMLPPPTAAARLGTKVRKAGHLLMKRWLAPRDGGLLLLTNETWRQFWVCLRGPHLLFQTDSGSLASPPSVQNLSIISSSNEVLQIDITNCLVQSVPEYPRRQHVFCLTTMLGEAFLLQVSSEADVEAWQQAIHTTAALILANTSSREIACKVIRSECQRMDVKMETVAKMVRLSQLPSVSTVSVNQLGDWERELEALHVQHYLAKSYVASIKGSEMPSCKKVLAAATKSTKSYLSHIGAFTGSSMHAYVFMRIMLIGASTPDVQRNMASSFNSRDSRDQRSNSPTQQPKPTIFQSKASLVQLQLSNGILGHSVVYKLRHHCITIKFVTYYGQVAVVSVTDNDSVAAVLQRACEKHGLDPHRYFILLRRTIAINEMFVPRDSEILQQKIPNHNIEIREKLVYHIHLVKPGGDKKTVFGLTIRAQKDVSATPSSKQQQLQPNGGSTVSLSVFVASVDEDGMAKKKGIIAGDELLSINKNSIKRLSAQAIEDLLQLSTTLCLVLRTKRIALPVWLEPLPYCSSQEQINLTCSPEGCSNVGPVSDTTPIEEDLPSASNSARTSGGPTDPNWFSDSNCGQQQPQTRVRYRKFGAARRNSLPSHHNQQKRYSFPAATAAMSTSLLQSPVVASARETISAQSSPRHCYDQRARLATGGKYSNRISSSEPGNIGADCQNGATTSQSNGRIAMTPQERLEKLIHELLETEKGYSTDLEGLVKQYLEPLSKQQLQLQEEVGRLLVCASEILRLQRKFLEELSEAVGTEFLASNSYTNLSHLRNGLLHLGGIFVMNAGKFKIYSTFATCHYKIQKLLKEEANNEHLQALLSSLNVRKQHAGSFESYLIKPTQRVVRYPLFLQQIKSLLSPNTPEFLQISEALSKMEKVAEYINETQRIYEQYGVAFGKLQQQQNGHQPKISLELSELLMFGEVDWLNYSDEPLANGSTNGASCSNNKRSALVSLSCVCFVFRSAIILLSQEPANKQSQQQSKPMAKKKNGQSTANTNNSSESFIQRLIPIAELEVNGNEQTSTSNQHVWVLIHISDRSANRPEKVYHFVNRKSEIKQQFLKAIKRAGHMMHKEMNGSLHVHISEPQSQPALNGASPLLDADPGNSVSKRNSANSEDQASLSSPDSGFPPPPPALLTATPLNNSSNQNNSSAVVNASSAEPAVARKEQQPQQNGKHQQQQRPTCYYSSQSDAGYGSNSEIACAHHLMITRKEQLVVQNGIKH